jgi:hypothetical protein
MSQGGRLTPRTAPSTARDILSGVNDPASRLSLAFFGMMVMRSSVTIPAHELVSVVVTSLAKTPFAAAQRPDRRA